MQKKLLSLALTIMVFGFAVKAQVGTGSIQGIVTDEKTGEPIPFANVVIELNGNLVTGGTTDFDGKYNIKPVAPGRYTVKSSSVGYSTQQIDKVQISESQITFQNFKMSSGVKLGEVVVKEYVVPLIKQDGGSETTLTSQDIQKMPGRTADVAATTVAGVYSQDGERGSIRGSRSDATDTYIDGVRVRGSSSIPQSAIEQVTVVTGGLPAQFGDATGGVISITTKGPSRQFYGGAELVTSQYLDAYGYNLAALNVSGPLILIKDKENEGKKKPLFGFFLSAEGNYQKDPKPSAIGSYKVKDDVLANLEQNPLRPSGLTTGGSYLNSQFIHSGDLEKIKARQNVAQKGLTLAGKIDLSTSGTTNLTFGGSADLNGYQNYDYNNVLFNSSNNGQVINNTMRAFGRFTQRFLQKDDKEGKGGGVRNAYYTIQVDYTKFLQTVQDPDHKDNLFDYGYVGKFKRYTIPTYGFGIDTTTGLFGRILNGFRDTLIEFTPSDINPLTSNYTSQFYAQNPDAIGNYENITQIQNKGGILNGQDPKTVYSLWNNTGAQYDRYSKTDQTSVRITALGSVDLKNHAFTLGFEYEQRTDRSISYNPVGLWTQARLLTNNHIKEIDVTQPQPVYLNGVFQDTINYPRLYNQSGQAFFDYNLRKSLGLPTNGLDFLDLDSYDPKSININFFSADELLNSGINSYVNYYGYDYTGKKISNKQNFDDFFTAKDEFGNYKRQVGAFMPTYLAGYIQDKFAFKDLIFNVGVRVDRYDANQKVLKDPFSLFDTKKAGEVTTIGGNAVSHPSNIGDDYVVYVNDINSPTAIVGYRSGRTWYNAEGVEITDPTVLKTGSGIAPYLVDPSDKVISSKAFKDYQPQTNIMPRISFSFPISEDALFFAHYDVLTKRPIEGNRLDPIDYLYILNRSQSNVINNPDLKPEKTIDYELGFQQKLSANSALKFSAFYRELRNLIQVTKVLEAYPKTYTTYGNLDFGTVKGLSLSYDMRKVGNLAMRASYTLQFADGTGSNSTTGVNLVNSGYGNLRTIQPLTFDQRHNIVVTMDYRYKSGVDYNGPVLFKQQILANTGFNMIARAGSGTPYTRQMSATNEGNIGGGTTSIIDGSINGSRLPWNFKIDIRIDKDIPLNFAKKDAKKKPGNLTIYVQVLNLLNTKNVIKVYRKTGNPNDDGYLGAAEFQNNIASQNDAQSYRDLYATKVNDPGNYSQPRRIRLGLMFNF